MKKILYSIILIISICLLGLIFLNNNIYAAVKTSGAHIHSYTKQISIVTPTCTRNGYIIKQCNNKTCNKTTIVSMSKTNHNYSKLVSKLDATCTKDGYKIFKCTTCSLTKKVKINKLDHYYVYDKTKHPDSSTHVMKCTRSGCGATFSQPHKMNKATCTTGEKCRICNWTNGKALGHNFNNIKSKLNPTCTKDGYKIYECTRCYSTKKETIKKLDHNYKLDSKKDPTCTEDGYKRYECVNCTSRKTVKINNLGGHIFVYDKTKQPDSSTHVMKCTNSGCKKTSSQKHDMTTATCTTAAKCKVCNWTNGKLKSHEFSKEITYKQNVQDISTHFKIRTCKICGMEVKGSKTPHTFKEVNKKTKECVCGIIQENGRLKVKNDEMYYTIIEGKGSNATLLLGGNTEMNDTEKTIEKYKTVIENNEGPIIVATTTVNKDDEQNFGKKGLVWVKGHDNNVSNTVKQIQENNVNIVEAYSSGSYQGIVTVSEMASKKDNPVKELILYDGFFGVSNTGIDVLKNILDSGVTVYFYYAQDTINEVKEYKSVMNQINGLKSDNLKIIKVDSKATHGNVIEYAQEERNKGK